MVKFVVLSTQRSGSTWVIDVLNSHPAVVAYDELFLRTSNDESPLWGGNKNVSRWNAYWERERVGVKSPFKKIYLCFKYLEGIYSLDSETVQAVGFKLMYAQLSRNLFSLLSYFLSKRVALIHLMRLNFLDVILSEEAVRIRNAPHAYGKVQQVPIFLDTTSLLHKLRKKESKVRWARTAFSCLGLPYLEVSYEDLAEGHIGFDALLGFLGIRSDGLPLHSSLRKLNQGTHKELIKNYDEVAAALVNTRFSGLLR